MLTDLKLKLMDFLSSHDVAGLSLLSACTADYNNRNDIGDEGAEIIKNMIYDFIHPSLDSTLPQVASATLLCGLDALTDIVLLADGDPISTWADQSGNGNNFTQTGIARPTKQTVGGYAAVVPDGVDDWMDGGNFAENLDVFSIIIVEHFGGHGGILMSKDEVDIDWNYNGWLIGNKAAIDLYQQPAPNDYRNLRQGASADPTNGLHVFGSEKISNTELHSYIDNALVDNFVPEIGRAHV